MSHESPVFPRVGTILLRVAALEPAVAWYRAMLGVHPVHEDAEQRLAVLALPEGPPLTLWERTDRHPVPDGTVSGTYPIFDTADAAAAHRTLTARGVACEPIADGPGVRFFGFRDLDGNALEACQMVEG